MGQIPASWSLGLACQFQGREADPYIIGGSRGSNFTLILPVGRDTIYHGFFQGATNAERFTSLQAANGVAAFVFDNAP